MQIKTGGKDQAALSGWEKENLGFLGMPRRQYVPKSGCCMLPTNCLEQISCLKWQGCQGGRRLLSNTEEKRLRHGKGFENKELF